MYHYWGFGLHILSEIAFPELLPFDFEIPDITICFGKTPEALNGEEVVRRVRVSISANEYLLKIPDLACYYAGNGNKIVVEPLMKGDIKSIRLFLLSNVMAAVLHQRDMIPLHASGVFYQEGVALFCGESGAGKSTLTIALNQRGYRIFSDDICVLRVSPVEQVTATASYPMTKLWSDSFTKLGVEMAAEESRIRPQLPKYARYYHESFTTEALPVKSIFILGKSAHLTAPELKPLVSMRAFAEIQKNTYRPLQMNAMQKRNIHFATITKLAASSAAYQVTRPEHQNSLEQLASLIETYLQ